MVHKRSYVCGVGVIQLTGDLLEILNQITKLYIHAMEEPFCMANVHSGTKVA